MSASDDGERLLDELRRESDFDRLRRLLPALALLMVLVLLGAGVAAYLEHRNALAMQQAAAVFESGGIPERAPYRAPALVRASETAAPAEAIRLLREAADVAGDPLLREALLLKAAARMLQEHPESVEPMLTDVQRLSAQADELRALAALRLNNRPAARAALNRALAAPNLAPAAQRRLEMLLRSVSDAA